MHVGKGWTCVVLCDTTYDDCGEIVFFDISQAVKKLHSKKILS